MPRKKLIYTDEFPYHVTARSNNKEWFYLPLSEVWRIFCSELTEASFRFNFSIHAFVLMSNHFHLICSCSKEFPLSKVMEWLLRSVNRKINNKANRINHVFGGPYKGSLITTNYYYYHALKYVYQNPVTAKLVTGVTDYKFSSLDTEKIPLTSLITGISSFIPKCEVEYINYLDEKYGDDELHLLKNAIKRAEMKWSNQITREMKSSLMRGY